MMQSSHLRSISLLAVAAPLLAGAPLAAQQPAKAPAADELRVQAIAPARNPLPPEAASAGITRFSFIAYGDTRGRQDGIALEYEHSLVIASMLRTIAALASGPDPVRFVLQSGDAVSNGREVRQWNVSYVGW